VRKKERKKFSKMRLYKLSDFSNYRGDERRTSRTEQLSTEEQRLIQQLRKHPELMERFKHIMEIAADTEGPIKTADEVEALLIEEMRRLGNATMQGWGEQVEQRLAEQLKQKNVSAVVRKKKR